MKSQEAVVALSALGQDSRLALFRLLVRRGREGCTPTQLTEKLDVPPPTLSFHLKELQRARLIGVRRVGRQLFYRPNATAVRELIRFLSDQCMP